MFMFNAIAKRMKARKLRELRKTHDVSHYQLDQKELKAMVVRALLLKNAVIRPNADLACTFSDHGVFVIVSTPLSQGATL